MEDDYAAARKREDDYKNSLAAAAAGHRKGWTQGLGNRLRSTRDGFCVVIYPNRDGTSGGKVRDNRMRVARISRLPYLHDRAVMLAAWDVIEQMRRGGGG